MVGDEPWLGSGGEMARLVRARDWAKTPVGEPERWPQPLKATLAMALDAAIPMAIYWGPQLTLFYNDKSIELIGARHPAALGQPAARAFPRIWDIMEPVLARVLSGGGASVQERLLPVFRSGQTESVWFDLVTNPIPLDDGTVGGVLVIGMETARRPSTDRAIRRLFDAAPTPIVVLGTDAPRFTIMEVNEAYAGAAGKTRGDLVGRSFFDVFAPQAAAAGLLEEVRASLDRALASKQADRMPRRTYEIFPGPPGEDVHSWEIGNNPILDEDGQIAAITHRVFEVTQEERAERVRRESEQRFRQFAEASSDLLWIRDAETLAHEYVSPAFAAIYGHSVEDLAACPDLWSAVILPEDRARALETLSLVRAGELVTHEFRIERPDGSTRWIRSTDFPMRDEAGRVERIGGVTEDVTAARQTAERLQVLMAELQHRTRNLVGIIRSIALRTAASSVSLEDFRTRFIARLEAIARVNGLLSRLSEGTRIGFDELVRAELLAHGAIDQAGAGSQVRLEGPPGVRLRSSTVQTLALALHELATNAVKYGALSRPEGHLTVVWAIVEGEGGTPCLRVDWTEHGVPSAVPSEPPPRGYGLELIERALPYSLGAQTRYELTADGVRCSIVLPLSPPRAG